MADLDAKKVMALFERAMKTGDREDVHQFLALSRTHVEAFTAMFRKVARAHKEHANEYCRKATRMPAVYSKDKSYNKETEQFASECELGEDSKFDLNSIRSTGFDARHVIIQLVEMLEGIRMGDAPGNDPEGVEPNDFRLRILNLPELSKKTIKQWTPVIYEFGLDLNKPFQTSEISPRLLANTALIKASWSFVEARLESKKKRALKAAQKAYPQHKFHDALFEAYGDKKLSISELAKLTKYQQKIREIEAMEPDAQCLRYGAERHVRETLERILK